MSDPKISSIVSGGAGKGDAPRKVSLKKYQQNYDAIFKKPKKRKPRK